VFLSLCSGREKEGEAFKVEYEYEISTSQPGF
jgi:hypothetical protein